MKGIIGKKIGMTAIFNEEGHRIPCTVIEAGPCTVTQLKTEDKDGYNAVQLGFDNKKDKKTTAALKGHFKKSGSSPRKKLAEIRDMEGEFKAGQELKVDLFEEKSLVDVSGYSYGKGNQGVMKRHGFSGVGGQTHGQKDQARRGGSIGGASDPGRVFKGMRMPGRKGNEKNKIANLEILKILPEKNLLFVKGAVPGKKGSYLIIEQ